MSQTPIYDALSSSTLSSECQIRLRWVFMVEAFEEIHGQPPRVSQRTRTYEEQKALYDRWKRRQGRNYLYPGEKP